MIRHDKDSSAHHTAAMFGSAALALAALLLGTGPASAAQTLGPVTDEIGVLRIPKGAPIQIGGYWVITGADAALGVDEQRGVQIALRDNKDTIAGHPARL